MGLDLAIYQESVFRQFGTVEHTDISFGIDEWAIFFYQELSVPKPTPYDRGVDADLFYRNERSIWDAALVEFPKLARINDYYSDTEFAPGEVQNLFDECMIVRSRLNEPLAISFVNGLITGCEEAIPLNRGLILLAD